ncbi:MAG: T9SS type A sorting domain-containing protein [Bacteroidetes bacterium]|nr:T9SS type A sorting domain-containing protein [Bacteroidota bacterium]
MMVLQPKAFQYMMYLKVLFRFALALCVWFQVAPAAFGQIGSDQYEDVSAEFGFGQWFYSWGSAWGDQNGDGKPDLFLGNHYRVKDRNLPYLYLHDGGFFTRDTLPDYDSVKDMHGSAWMDFDNDGDDDLYIVTGRAAGNLLLVNDGSGGLTDQTLPWGVAMTDARGRTPIWFDANRDGKLDLLTTNGNPLSPLNRINTLLIQGEGQFQTSLIDSMTAIGRISGSGAMIGDPWGAGWASLGLFSDKALHWLLPGCLPMYQQYRFDKTDLEQVIPGDFNGDGLTDLYLVRADQSQANASADYPINYKESFSINFIHPDSSTWIRTPRHATGTLSPDGTLTYVPDPGFAGPDSMAINVCDSFGTCINKVIYLMVDPVPATAGTNPFPVKTDSFLVISLSDLIHPFRHSLRLILYPRDTLHQAVRLKVASDSLLLLAEPAFAVSADSIFVGSTGWHPEASDRYLFNKSNPACWGAFPYSPGTGRGLYIHYELATDEWVIAFNTHSVDQRSDAFLFSTDSFRVSGYLNFSDVAQLTADVMLFSNGFGYDEVTEWAGLGVPNAAVAGAALDVDNDGDLDLYLSCGLLDRNQPNLLWENLGNGQFVPVVLAGGAEGPLVGSGGTPSAADFNGDGFLDLFLENGRGNGSGIPGPYVLLRNRGNSNSWLRLKLQGRASSRDAIGTVAELWSGGKKQIRIADGGQNRYSQSQRILHFGLGAAEQADSIILRWPSGIVQRIPPVAGSQTVTVTEPIGGIPTACLSPAQLALALPDDPLSEDPLTFSWMRMPCNSGFQVQTTNSVSGEVIRYRVDSASLVLDQSIFVPGQEYRWEVRMLCLDTTWSLWSLPKRFTLEKPSSVEALYAPQQPSGFSLVPNPAQTWVEIRAEQYPLQPWTAHLYDAAGQLRVQQACTASQACRIALTNLEAGVYAVRIGDGQKVQSLRLIRAQAR